MRILKKLKQGYTNKNKIFAFDVETKQVKVDDHIEQEFMMGSIVGDNFLRTFWDKQKMSDFISKDFILRDASLFATNLDFDFRHAVMGTNNYKDFDKISMGGAIIYANKKEKNHSWKCLDTWNFTGKIALKKMGEQLGIEKLESPKCFKYEPSNHLEKLEMERYNIRDSLITYKYAKFLQKFFDTLGCRMKLTIASTGLDNWRRYGQPVDIFPEREEWVRKHYLGSFRGGRTEVFKRGYVEGVYCYDYNSMYPGVCRDGIDGKGSYPNPSSAHFIRNGDEDIIKNFEGISKVTLFSPDKYMPLVGVKTNKGKLVFPKGLIVNKWLTNIEIRTALKQGYDLLGVGESLYYLDTFVPFRKLIINLYNLRLDYRKAGNRPMEQMIKTMMNSGTFGKFCQKLDGFEEEIHKDNVFSDSMGNLGIARNGKLVLFTDYLERGECFYIKKETKRIPLFTMPILSSYTTAMSRIKFHKDFSKYEKYLCYGDTDSGHFTKKVFSDSNELGKLKLEYKFDKAVYIKPKLYSGHKEDGNDIFKSKGIGKFISKREHWDSMIKTKHVVTERFTKYKESCIRKIPYSSIIKVPKNLSLEDNKRDWLGKRFNHRSLQDSRPIDFETF